MGQSINIQYLAKGPTEFTLPQGQFLTAVVDVTGNTMQTATFSSSASGGLLSTATFNNTGDFSIGCRWFQAKIFQKGSLLTAATGPGVTSGNQMYCLEVSNQSSFPATLGGVTSAGTEVVATGTMDTTSSYGSLYLVGFSGEQTYRFARIRVATAATTSQTYDAFINASP